MLPTRKSKRLYLIKLRVVNRTQGSVWTTMRFITFILIRSTTLDSNAAFILFCRRKNQHVLSKNTMILQERMSPKRSELIQAIVRTQVNRKGVYMTSFKRGYNVILRSCFHQNQRFALTTYRKRTFLGCVHSLF